ncbi:AAA+ ATPase [Pelomyxa schiedti]|nr:AAA+ ATPase [Pelomyxa schiedti]
MQIHRTRLELEIMGHPHFQGNDDLLNKPGELMNIEILQALHTLLKQQLAEWKELMVEVYNRQPRLNFLSERQLTRFGAALTTVAAEYASTPQSATHKVQTLTGPYLWACFPDVEAIPPETVLQCLTSAIVEIGGRPEPVPVVEGAATVVVPQGAAVCWNPVSLVRLVLCFVTQVANLKAVQVKAAGGTSATTSDNSQDIVVQLAEGFTPNALMHLLFENFSFQKPHPSTILHCKNANKSDLERFLRCISGFPHLTFAIVGVNEMTDELRQELLYKWSSKMATQDRPKAKTFLIFTSRVGIGAFSNSIVKQQTVVLEEVKVRIATSPLNPQQIMENAKASVVCYSGGPGTGKSTEIRAKMEQSKKNLEPLCISMTECFSISDAIPKLSPLLKVASGAEATPFVANVHFDVSAYADMSVVSTFFYNMLMWSVVWDAETAAPPSDALEGFGFESTELVLQNIPILKHVGSFVKQCGIPFVVDNNTLLVSKFLQANKKSLLDNPTGLVAELDANPLSFDLVAVLEDFFHSSSSPPAGFNLLSLSTDRMLQQRFVSLLADRCKWLSVHARQRLTLFNSCELANNLSGTVPISKLFQMFVEESHVLCNPPLGSEQFIYTAREKPPPHRKDSVVVMQLPIVIPVMEHVPPQLPVPGEFVLPLAGAVEDPRLLRQQLQLTFGMENIQEVIERKKYILTPDFALKMLLVYDHMNAGTNLVISGGTGTGKTELLDVFGTLLNSRTKLTPNLVSKTNKFVLGKMLSSIPAIPKPLLIQCRAILQGQPQSKVPQTPLKIVTPKNALSNTCCLEWLDDNEFFRQFLLGMLNAHINLFPQFASRIVQFLKNNLMKRRYISLNDTGNLSRVLDDTLCQPEENPKAENRVVHYIEELADLVMSFRKAKFEKVFHKIRMHKGLSTAEFRERINEIKETLTKFPKDTKVVCFIDKCTSTTSLLGIVKEVLCDSRLDGEPLPKNLFFVATLSNNQPSIPPPAVNNTRCQVELVASVQNQIDFVGIASKFGTKSFAVRPPPLSMEKMTVNFGKLTKQQAESFTWVLILSHLKDNPHFDRNCAKQLTSLVLFGQDFINSAKIHRVTASIRDIARAVDLYLYFLQHKQFMFNLPHPSASNYSTHVHWQAMDSLLKFIISNFNNAPEYLIMWDDYFNKGVLNSLCNNTHLPPGIAKTVAFMENLFCTVVCLDAKIPLLIVGPPGCSKTLIFKVAVDNMKGQTSPKGEQSTFIEIKSVFKYAIHRQKTLPVDSQELCAVLFDEVRLPNEEKYPLEISNIHLDHKISCLLLSRSILDEAITNRTLMLLESEPPLTDLQTLAEGCIFGSDTSIAWGTREVLGALCTAYQAEVSKIYGSPYPARFFHLRDFVYFLRFLGKHCSGNRAGDAFHISHDVVLSGLRRNFGGLVQSDFDKLVANFFDNINWALKKHAQPLWTAPAADQRRTEISSIKESLAERLTDADDPNTAPFRYIMLLDPTDNEVAVSLLFDLGLCDHNQTSVCCIGDFRDDSDLRAKAAVVKKVKVAMEKGETIVLVNSASILSSFYDIFNRHYTIMPKNKQDMAKYPTNTSTRLCYANVAAGSFSQPCLVHDNFRIIVHIPKSSLQTIPTALLSRFEKYCLGIDDALFERLQILPRTKLISPTSQVPLQPYEVLCNGVQHMVHELHTLASNSRLFYGVSPKETVSSLVLTVLDRTLEMIKLRAQEEDPYTLPPLFPSLLGSEPNNLELFGARDHWEQNMREYMIKANLHILQLAKPESIYFCKQLPERYKYSYLLEQEHFSFYRFLGYLVQVHFSIAPHAPSKSLDATSNQRERTEPTATTVVVSQRGEYSSKWCVFTRTSAEIITLPTDKNLQSKMFDVLVQTGSVPQGPEQNPGDWMEVLSLGDMSSSQQCSSRVHDFCCSPMKLLLLCVVDLSVATPNQINFLRNEINERWKVLEEHHREAPNKGQYLQRIAVLLLHFSAEIGMRAESAYHAIFLNGWDFLFVDALGVVAGSSGANPHSEVDPRPWLARAFGLNLRDSESDHMKRDSSTQEMDTFRGLFFEVLRQFCKFMTGSGINTTTSTLDNQRAKDFYGKPNNGDACGSPQSLNICIAEKSEERFQILKQLFEENPVLYEGILEQFSRSWTSGFPNKLVCEASTELFRGSCVVSFVTATSLSRRNCMAPLVSTMLQMMLSSFGLNSVFNMLENRQKGKLLELVHRVYRTIPIPQLGKSVLTNSKQLNCTVLRAHPFPPELPFYDSIAHLVNTQVIHAAIEMRHHKPSPQALHWKVLESIRSNKLLDELLENITENQPLFNMFRRDFVTRSLKLSTLHISEFKNLLGSNAQAVDLEGRLGRFMEMILSYIREFKIALVEDIPELFVIKRFYEPEINYFMALVTPLHLLDPALTPEQFDRCRRPPRFEKNQLQEMVKWVTTLTADLLWERLTQEILTGGPKLDSHATVNWGQVYRHFFSTLKSRSELATLLSNSPETIQKLDAMHVVFVFLSNCRAEGFKPTFPFLTRARSLSQVLGQFVSTLYTPGTRLKSGLLLALNLLPPDPSKSSDEDIQSIGGVVEYLLQESDKSMLSDDSKSNFSCFLQVRFHLHFNLRSYSRLSVFSDLQ